MAVMTDRPGHLAGGRNPDGGIALAVARHLVWPEPETREEAGALMADLTRLLSLLDHAYYDLDSPLAADEDYDRLLRRLERLEAGWPDLASAVSSARQVGGTVSAKFASVPHPYPMLSLLDVFSREEVMAFALKTASQSGPTPYLVQMKIDGLSVSLTYREGRLIRGVTRGDGVTAGEDITENIAMIPAIPHLLTEPVSELAVRGEVFMPFRSFERLNTTLEARGEKTFANPRNAASGTLRQLDASIVAGRGLSFFAFEIQHADRTFERDSEALAWLSTLGFLTIPNARIVTGGEEIMKAIDAIDDARASLPFAIDGAVVKLDRLDDRERLGTASKYPRWAVAYKYPPEQKETTILDITAQVGRTGRLTPLASLEPVRLAGTQVSRATLHNQSYIDLLDVRVGDRVLVQKGGDIIPAVVGVVKEKRPQGTVPYQLPKACPVCGSGTAFKDGGVDLYCTFIDCPAQLVRHLTYFASRDAMDIEGIGERTAQALVDRGYVKSIADLYQLAQIRDQLIEDGSVGRQKSVDRLLEQIERSKNLPPDRLLTGLGISQVGRQTARLLLKAIPDIHELARTEEEALAAIRDIGPVTAREIRNWFSMPRSRELLERLESYGLSFHQETEASPLPLADTTYVITGTLASMTRNEARARLEALGARVASQVSPSTTGIIVGENPGSKADRAGQLGRPIMDEDAFLAWLDQLQKEGR